jgi:hypothetical protein
MTDRIAFIAENSRSSCRGLSVDPDGAFYAELGEGEIDTFTIDAGSWLQQGETIDAVEITPDGLTADLISNNDARVVLNLSKTGDAKVLLTTTEGRVKRVTFRVYPRPITETPA